MKVNAGRLWLSLKRAFTLTCVVYFLIEFIEIFSGDPIVPLLKRLPLAWVWYWPKLFLSRGAIVTDRDLFVSLALNIAAYTVVIYAISWLMVKRKEADE
jgi:hypothetical protein